MKDCKLRVAIAGYGNIGKAVEKMLQLTPDMELICIFTRRDPKTLKALSPVPIIHTNDMYNWENKIDVVFLCMGSAKDLPLMGPLFARYFNTVCSFDTHAKIPEYFQAMKEATYNSDKISIISIGWDPGLFSIMRLLMETILPNSKSYTFWGEGISQGHSDAIRRIDGVKDARQYTIPIKDTLDSIRSGETPNLTNRQKHTRLCYVVAKDGADKEKIEHEIKTMPNYFAPYDTTVIFVSQEKLNRNHSKMPHGGTVICNGETSSDVKQLMEFSLKLDSNPEFTASVLIAYGRAAFEMWYYDKLSGAKTIFDIPLSYLSPLSHAEVIRKFL